jgi:hypothetical protein
VLQISQRFNSTKTRRAYGQRLADFGDVTVSRRWFDDYRESHGAPQKVQATRGDSSSLAAIARQLNSTRLLEFS